MTENHRIPKPWLTTALKVALVYLAAGGLWIAFSDMVLARLFRDAGELSHWQTVKGFLFVGLTGGLLFAYLHRSLRRQYETFHELTTLFDSITAVVYVADMQSYELLFVNQFASRQFGGQWQQRKCFDYLQQGQSQPCGFCTNLLLLRDGQPGPSMTWEFRNTRNGHWYQCLDKAIRWPDGRLVRLEIAFDITTRKELERTKDELLSAVSHEMRTPLTAITGFSELLLDESSLSAPVRQHIETIFREAEKLQELIQTFLEVRRLKTDQTRTDYEVLAVKGLLEQASSRSGECTGEHRLTIDCSQELVVYGNRRELTQVLKQLTANACRFSPEGGDILLSGQAAGNFVEITIADQGIGIPIEEQESIFEPFHRIDIGDRRRFHGIGLGLAMVRGIVALHGGTVRVESTLGQGSRFTVNLPQPLSFTPSDSQGFSA